jgi:hypothetical protein
MKLQSGATRFQGDTIMLRGGGKSRNPTSSFDGTDGLQ